MINISFNSKKLPKQPPEFTYGNKEYKISLDYLKETKKNLNKLLEKKASQMLFRLFEGDGKAIYLIGVEDNGNVPGITLRNLLISIYNLIKITKKINVNIKKITIYNGIYGYIASIRLNKFIHSISLF